MKILNLKSILFSLMAIAAISIVMTSCEKEATPLIEKVSVEQSTYKTGDLIDDVSTMEEFNSLMRSENLSLAIEENEVRLQNNEGVELRNCSTCKPKIYSVNVYDLGNNEIGLGVSGGRHYPCDYNISFHHGSDVQTIWTYGGFGRFKLLNGMGHYCLNVKLKSCTPVGSCCNLIETVNYYND